MEDKPSLPSIFERRRCDGGDKMDFNLIIGIVSLTFAWISLWGSLEIDIKIKKK